MDPSFEGKVALVTGGSRGIGRAIATGLARAGAKVAITYRSSRVEPIGEGLALPLDLTDPEGPPRVAEEVRERLGPVEILVNNAGVRRDGMIFTLDEAEWSEVIETHLLGAYRMTRAVIVSMMKARSGSILNIASVSGLLGTAGQTSYSAAKAGLMGFTKALAREAAPRGVRVNALALGLIDSGMTRDLPDRVRERILGETPLARLGTEPEVVGPALYLLSERASYVTGQVVRVDGGVAT
jgi:3-oxoacyl-[acyl-carrier protein] reductase